MSPFQFLKQLKNVPSAGGDGVRIEKQFNPIADFRTAAGLVLTAATSPAVVAVETNALVVSAIAPNTPLGSFVFAVPKDYDQVADELTIRLIVQMSGATDTPTTNATAYRKRAGSALSAALTSVASAAAGATSAELSITLSGNGLRPDDMLTINLVSGAHATDTMNVYGCDVVYKSNVVFYDTTAR
jgi:hypothetical protein